jgi:hypothetical protein
VKQGLASAREARKKKRPMNILAIKDDREEMTLHESGLEDSSYNQKLIRSYSKQTPYHLDIAEHGGHRVGRFKSSNYGDGWL